MVVPVLLITAGLILILLGILMMIFSEINQPLGLIIIAIGILMIIRGIRRKE
jgi:uncharacterized membrane protein